MKRQASEWIAGAFLLLFSVLLSACSADKQPSRMEETLANMVKDVAIPMQALNLKNPIERSDAVLEQGQQIFGQACSICHGANGRADVELGQSMYPPAMDLTSPHVASWNDAELFWIIQNGIRFTGMPAWKYRIGEEDTWKLIHFVRNLPNWNAFRAAPEAATSGAGKSPAELIHYGRTLYRQEGCFMCHQLEGEGGTIGPDLSLQGTRGRSDDWLVGHFKDPPAYTKGSIMPSFKNLTGDQLRALVAFLQSQKGSSRGAARAPSRR